MKIFILCWFDEPLEAIKIVAREFTNIGHIVDMCGNFNHIDFNMFCFNKVCIFDPDFIIVWNIYQDKELLEKLSCRYKLVMFNWDDPHVLRNKDFVNTIKYYSVCFTSCLESREIYNKYSKHVYLLPPVDHNIHYYDFNNEYICDIAVVITNLYEDENYFSNQIINRYKLITELIKYFNVNIYGPEYLGKIFYGQFRGFIPYELNRKVFSSAKLVLNTHVENAEGYFNERTLHIMACSGLMLIDNIKSSSILNNCCIILDDSIEKIIKQIKNILDNIDDYDHIRKNAYKKSLDYNVSKWCNTIISNLHKD